MAKSVKEVITVGRRQLEVSNLSKVFYPGNGWTKGDVIKYYSEVSEVLLKHLKNRPLTLKRYPDGVAGSHFYEKDAPGHTPSWVKTFSIARKVAKKGDTSIEYVLVNNLQTLLWTVNLANIEMHAFLAKAPKVHQPTSVVFDLDPGPPATVLDCAEVALELKALFDQLELASFVKVSGSKGLQVYIPLNTPVSYELTSTFAKAVAKLMSAKHPDKILATMSKAAREGKVFIDWSQNNDFKTTVVAYALRAKTDVPYVSLPVEWKELSSALKKDNSEKLYFTPKQTLTRIKSRGDLFAPLLMLKQRLPKDFADAVRSEHPKPRKTKKLPTSARKGTDMKAYQAKRDFNRTKEPTPAVGKTSGKERRFVIQKHQASRLHYDFRLEMEGVLRSWAVPKGPSTTKGERRLAVHVEDHPLTYADFEGTIPAGNYGAGTVMVWDQGTYTVEDTDPVSSYKKGKIHLHLEGDKLKGEWALVRTSDEKKWFLIKVGKSIRAISKKRDDQSVLTARTMKKITDENTAQWKSNRAK